MSHSPTEISILKAQYRLEMRAYRASLHENVRTSASAKVCKILDDWPISHAALRVAIYLALPGEINLDALAKELLHADNIVCAPRLDTATGTMRFVRLRDLNAVTRGAYGVREPIADEIVRPDFALVPGLAFDRRGGRLGMGGGWYDRVLAHVPIKVGVGFCGQIVQAVPVEAHDIKLDWLVSEMGLSKCESVCREHFRDHQKSELEP